MLMVLLFVGGVMNLAWITAITLVILVEKTLPRGALASYTIAIVLIAWGAVTLTDPRSDWMIVIWQLLFAQAA